jgi:hypothetical protein
MLTCFLHSRTAWNDYFPGSNSPNYNSQTYTSRQAPSVTNVYVSNCLFKSITYTSGNGGALYCTSATYFLVESSSFFSCKSNGEGGGIYFSKSGSQSVLYKICAYDCCTTTSSWYQFASIIVNNDASSKNYFIYSSATRCLNGVSNSWHVLGLNKGKSYCPSVNISLNKCFGGTGMSCWPTIDSNSFTCSLTYSSFTDNHATGHTCFWLDAVGAEYEIKSCNIIRHTQDNLGTYGTIYISGNAKIEDSCIFENKANIIFYQGSSSYTITLSNCTMDKTSKTRNVVIQNTVTKSFILALNHMSTRSCHAEYDSAGYLTHIIQTPSSSKKPVICYTYVKRFDQPRLSDFFSLHSIFIFNFIHPHASSYI